MRLAPTIVDPPLSRALFDQGTAPLVRSDAYERMGIRVIERDHPVLVVGIYWKAACREIRLHVQADNYDYLPPRGWWVGSDNDGGDSDVGLPLPAGMMPSGRGFQRPPNPYGENLGWLCFPGWREYHDHQSHRDDGWASRSPLPECRLPGTLVQLARSLNTPEVPAPDV